MNKKVAPKTIATNYILIGDKNHQMEEAAKIVQQIEKDSPYLFEGKRASFPYELRYVLPYDKYFHELKRLQATAAQAAGFRDEYRGYIILDLSSYLRHEEESYFEITLKYLYDMKEDWKYIFILHKEGKNEKALRDMVRKMMTILGELHFVISEEALEEPTIGQEELLAICKECGVTCSIPVMNYLKEFMKDKEYNRSVIVALLRGVVDYYSSNRKINVAMLREYLQKGNPTIHYMLSVKAYKELLTDILQKENEVEIYGKAV